MPEEKGKSLRARSFYLVGGVYKNARMLNRGLKLWDEEAVADVVSIFFILCNLYVSLN
jgi:hypothetical protein